MTLSLTTAIVGKVAVGALGSRSHAPKASAVTAPRADRLSAADAWPRRAGRERLTRASKRVKVFRSWT
jgi:hypothetical protein